MRDRRACPRPADARSGPGPWPPTPSALMISGRGRGGRRAGPSRRGPRPGPPRRPWVEADALVTLGLLAEPGRPTRRSHRAVRRGARAGPWTGRRAGRASCGRLSMLARDHLERGELADAARVAHEGRAAGRRRRPRPGALRPGRAVPALPGRTTRDGDWDHAQELADGFGVRVDSAARGPVCPPWPCSSTWPGAARSRPSAGRLAGPLWAQDELRRVHRPRPARRARAAGRATPDRGGRGRGHDRPALG